MLETPCIEWTNRKSPQGYGVKMFKGKEVLVHRWVFQQLTNNSLKGLVVRHKCDNKPCFRFDHLESGTQGQNVKDSWDRTDRKNGNNTKTHCKHGHEFTVKNTRIISGRRQCRACCAQRERDRRSRVNNG